MDFVFLSATAIVSGHVRTFPSRCTFEQIKTSAWLPRLVTTFSATHGAHAMRGATTQAVRAAAQTREPTRAFNAPSAH
jgi:hypothetical protein